MSHESRGLPRLRTVLVSAAVIFGTCLAAASDDAASSLACGTLSVPSKLDPTASRANPSKLDYLVLASMADSPRPLTMASYTRATSARRDQAQPGGNTPVVFR
jgi:hypothetical protein